MNRGICFVGSDSYTVLNRNYSAGYVGGESVQFTLLAKAFRDLGWQVSVIDMDYGQPDGQLINGISVYKTFRRNSGIPLIRFIYPRMISILKALKKADADIYYQSSAGMMTGIVSWFCKRYNRKFIFRTAHDTDCIRGKQLIRFWRDKKLYEYGLKHADIISVQGVNQKKLLYKNYGLRGFPVNMAVELPAKIEKADKDIDCLWVNNMRQFKRPEIFIELARSLPVYRFVMIGGQYGNLKSYYNNVSDLARQVRNLEFLGAIPYHKINSYFSRAKLFINTSETEGFPNSFLQAWVRGVPVISFFDPDDLIVTLNLGASPIDIIDMAASVQEFMHTPDKLIKVGKVSTEYTLQNYSPPSVAKSYIELLKTRNIH